MSPEGAALVPSGSLSSQETGGLRGPLAPMQVLQESARDTQRVFRGPRSPPDLVIYVAHQRESPGVNIDIGRACVRNRRMLQANADLAGMLERRRRPQRRLARGADGSPAV
ncbi:MAG: hypothetical protein ACT4PV_11860 [Planctomycetaceae bacterium]